MLQTALNWLQRGIAVIPVFYRSKKPALKSWIEFQSRLPTEKEVTNWFSHKFRNLGVVTGWQNLVVLDFDNFDTYSKWLLWATVGEPAMVAQYGCCVVTARGVHIYARCAGARNMKLPGIDIKACGGYVLAPPSVHPSGVEYVYLNNGPIIEISSIETILPGTWLQHHTEQPTFQAAELDPWEMASTRTQLNGIGTISKIKERVSILDLLNGRNIINTRNGWYITLCPFHQDTQPSFWIDTNRGLCGCYACGGKPMDVINLYAKLNQVDNRIAIQMLGGRI